MGLRKFTQGSRTYKPVPRRDLTSISGFGKENLEEGDELQEAGCAHCRPMRRHTDKQQVQVLQSIDGAGQATSVAVPCKRQKLDDHLESEPERQAIREPAKKRQPGKRTLVNHNTVAVMESEPETEYERQRAERIKRNAAVMESLALKQLASDFTAGVQQAQAARAGTAVRSQRKPRERPPRAAAPQLPARQSRRIRGAQPGEAGGEGATPGDFEEAGCSGETAFMELKEYFKWKGLAAPGFEVDGHFRGWVNPAICEQYDIAGTAEDAWEQNGGGKFSFRIDKSAIPASLKGKGWSDARAFSATQLKKNPNTYFYRHVAPHEQQAQGDWTEEEHELFMQTARTHGAGDKWGLFASYIPQRVGYQCSAHYREVVIPQGLIFDPNFRMTRNGRAVYVG